jgi:predicted DNA-binding transcriptional regulator AlpA
MSKSVTSAIQSANRPSPQTHPALIAFDTLPDSAFVPLPVVCGIYGCSPATAWRRVRAGQIVAPRRIGSRTTRWNVGEIRADLQGK